MARRNIPLRVLGNFKLHRLIFLYHKGYLPDVVDHKDGDQSNNRIENLRESNNSTNSFNTRISVNNSTGYKGVSYTSDPKRSKKPFRASIEFNGYVFGLGYYFDPRQAALAYNIAAKLLFKDFSNLNKVDLDEDKFRWKGKFFTEDYHQILNGTFDWSSKNRRDKKK